MVRRRQNGLSGEPSTRLCTPTDWDCLPWLCKAMIGIPALSVLHGVVDEGKEKGCTQLEQSRTSSSMAL
eukprot:1282788-Pyramimonas_sp.AAC.2